MEIYKGLRKLFQIEKSSLQSVTIVLLGQKCYFMQSYLKIQPETIATFFIKRPSRFSTNMPDFNNNTLNIPKTYPNGIMLNTKFKIKIKNKK